MRTTKKHIANKLSNITNLHPNQASIMVDHFFNILKEEMLSDNIIEIREFGVLKSFITKEKKARHILRNEQIIVPPKRTVKFYLSPILEHKINHFQQAH